MTASPPPFQGVIQPSIWLIGLVSALYGCMGLVWCSVALPLSVKKLGLVLHGLHFYTVWYEQLSLQSTIAIIYLEYTPENTWILGTNEGEVHAVILQSGSLCTASVVILRFYCMPYQTYRHVVLFKDSLPSSLFRQLRQRLSQYL